MELIRVAGPSITEKEVQYVEDAVRHAWYKDANIYNERFEAAFAEYVDRRYAISLPSCTSAIHLSLAALGVGPGDEVIVPDLTWIATAAPISYVRATPVFADIEPDSLCISPESIHSNLSKNTKAIIAVDLYGNMPNMDAVTEIAGKYGLHVIEDAAEAIGSEYRRRRAGGFGTTSVFSFHGSKTLTTGEGGMLVTNEQELHRRCLFLRDHGRSPGDTMFFNEEVAYKYRMTSMQAALGLAQLERVESLVSKKREIFSWYEEELGGVPFVDLNVTRPEVENSYWMVTMLVSEELGIEKRELITGLRQHSIDARPLFYPLSTIPAYRDSATAEKARASNKVAYAVSPYGINLPSGMDLKRGTVRYVCDTLKKILSDG